MPMLPLDMQNRQFRRVWHGYKPEEVDSFLDRLARDYEQIFRENSEFKDRLARAEEVLNHYQAMEATLKETLLVAQQAAEQVRHSASREAEVIQKEARLKAEEEMAKAEVKVREASQQFEEMHRLSLLFRGRMRSLLLTQLEMLQDGEREGRTESWESIE